MLGNYLQQMTSADDIFRCNFFLGALRVRSTKILCTGVLYLFISSSLDVIAEGIMCTGSLTEILMHTFRVVYKLVFFLFCNI